MASRSLRDLRVAEVVEQDLTVGADGAIESFRTKLKLSFKYEAEWSQAGVRAAEVERIVQA
jgi:dodecin